MFTGIIEGVGEVIASESDDVAVGDRVMAPTGWQRFSVHRARDVTVIPEPSSLGLLGLTAATLLLRRRR